MTGMAFTMCRGDFDAVFAIAVNQSSLADLKRVYDNVSDLTIPVTEWDLLGIGQHPDVPGAQSHFLEHWFAAYVKVDGAGNVTNWYTPTMYRNATPAVRNTWMPMVTSGWWIGWRGDAEMILRRSLIQTIQASLGMAPGDPFPATPVRRWPVDFAWMCGGHRFDAWVNWGGASATEGRVFAVVLTPGAKLSPVISDWDPTAHPNAIWSLKEDPGPGFHPNRMNANLMQGMVGIGHKDNVVRHYKISSAPTPPGAWKIGCTVEIPAPGTPPGPPKKTVCTAVHGAVNLPGQGASDVVWVAATLQEGGIQW